MVHLNEYYGYVGYFIDNKYIYIFIIREEVSFCYIRRLHVYQ